MASAGVSRGLKLTLFPIAVDPHVTGPSRGVSSHAWLTLIIWNNTPSKDIYSVTTHGAHMILLSPLCLSTYDMFAQTCLT